MDVGQLLHESTVIWAVAGRMGRADKDQGKEKQGRSHLTLKLHLCFHN